MKTNEVGEENEVSYKCCFYQMFNHNGNLFNQMTMIKGISLVEDFSSSISTK